VRFRDLFIAALLLLAPSLASAQMPGQNPAERAALIRDAFASTYGKALTADFGKALRKDADPACLGDKGLNPDQLEPRGRDLLIKWGTRVVDGIADLHDPKAFAERFPDSAEFERLKQNADVKRYLAISAPARQAAILDLVIEHFARYLLISRTKPVFASPLETGNQDILSKNPTDAVEKAMDRFVASKKSAALDRYLDLSDRAAAAQTASLKKEQVIALGGPHSFFKGVEADLAELCNGARR